jgi:L-arabinokinase
MIRLIQDGYVRTDLLLRLPFSDEMKVFPRREDVPLLARPGTDRRAEIAARTGARESCRWVLLSFTSLDWNDEALDRVARLAEYEFFVVDPLGWQRRNIHAIDRNLIPFRDVVASVDGVVSKPGFGIVSECLVNRKPLAYADRTDFLEYRLLKAAIDRYLKSIHIPAARLYAGDVAGALEALWARPEPQESVESGGAEVAARRIAQLAGI